MDAPTPRSDAEILRDYLAAHDAPCPGCRYNLRGLVGDRCPECSSALCLGVTRSRPGVMLLGVAVLGLGALGIASFFALVAIACITFWYGLELSGREASQWLLVPSVVLLVDGLAVAVALSARGTHQFLRLSVRQRAATALLLWGLSIGLFMLWLVWVVR